MQSPVRPATAGAVRKDYFMTKQNEKELLEVANIMDRSGSMDGKEEDTIGGFNAMLQKQQELDNVIYDMACDSDSDCDCYEGLDEDEIPL